MLTMLSAFRVQRSSAEILARAADAHHAAGTRRVSAARLAPTSGEVVTEFQSDSSPTDSPVRIRYAQPASTVSARPVQLTERCATFRRVGALDEVEPGAVLGREGELEAAGRSSGEPSSGFSQDVRGMIVEDQFDRGAGRIGGIEKLEGLDELSAAVAVSECASEFCCASF